MNNYGAKPVVEEAYAPQGSVHALIDAIWRLRQSELDPIVFRRKLGIDPYKLRSVCGDLPVLTEEEVEGWIRNIKAAGQLEKKLA